MASPLTKTTASFFVRPRRRFQRGPLSLLQERSYMDAKTRPSHSQMFDKSTGRAKQDHDPAVMSRSFVSKWGSILLMGGGGAAFWMHLKTNRNNHGSLLEPKEDDQDTKA